MPKVSRLLFGSESVNCILEQYNYNKINLEYPGCLKCQYYFLSVMLLKTPALYYINTGANETSIELMGATGIQDPCKHTQYHNKIMNFDFSAITSQAFPILLLFKFFYCFSI